MHQSIVNNRKAVVAKIDALIWELNRQKETLNEAGPVRLEPGLILARTADLIDANTDLSMSIARHVS